MASSAFFRSCFTTGRTLSCRQIPAAGARRGYSSSGTGGRNAFWTFAAAGACVTIGAAGATLYEYRKASKASNTNGIVSQVRNESIAYASKSQMLDVSRQVSHFQSPLTGQQAAKEISKKLGEDAVSYDEEVIEHHGRSDWSTANTSERPVAIIYPKSTEDVSIIARICNERSVPMVPFGAGSSVEGNFSSPYSGICIDFVHMDRVVAFHPEDMDVVVQPGVNWMNLNKEIAHAGLFVPLDPSPTAMIGGMVSTNCSGTNAMRYGTMKDWVLNLTVVLADGSVIKTRRRPRKTSAGYNLTTFFVGAEGTLGIVTEVTLKLAPIPQDTSVAVVSFTNVRDAAAAASDIMRSGIQLAALELMDELQVS